MADAKSAYESDLTSDLTSGKSYKIYKYLHSLANKNYLPATIYSDQVVTLQTLMETKQISSINSVFTKSNFILPSLCELPTYTVNSTTDSIIISEDEVFDVPSVLDPKKAMGQTSSNSKVLERLVFNKTIDHVSGIYPTI